MNATAELMDFIKASPTAFQAVANLCDRLDDAGFVRLNESDVWPLEAGRAYYFTRNQSSLIAFRLPESGFGHFQIVASHSDSPCFKLKSQAARASQGYATLNIEKYGGMIMSTWLDRPLSIAGRIIVQGDDGLTTRLIHLDRDLALIPNMPIHFNRSVNDGVALNPQVDMLPVYGIEDSDYIRLIAEQAGVDGARHARKREAHGKADEKGKGACHRRSCCGAGAGAFRGVRWMT